MEIVIKLCVHGVVMAVLFSSVVSASKSKNVSCVVHMVQEATNINLFNTTVTTI